MAKHKNDKACPVTREQFRKSAKPLTVNIDGKSLVATVKEFSTGSFGWYMGDKTVVEVDGIPCKVQVSLNLIIVGSKDAE